MVMRLLQLFSSDIFMALSVSPAFPSPTPGNVPPCHLKAFGPGHRAFSCVTNIDSFPVPLKVRILAGLFLFSSFLSSATGAFALTGAAGSAEGADILFSAILIEMEA